MNVKYVVGWAWGKGQDLTVFNYLFSTEEFNRSCSKFFGSLTSMEFDPYQKEQKLDFYHRRMLEIYVVRNLSKMRARLLHEV